MSPVDSSWNKLQIKLVFFPVNNTKKFLIAEQSIPSQCTGQGIKPQQSIESIDNAFIVHFFFYNLRKIVLYMPLI